MTIVTPVIGSTAWGGPLNAALEDLDTRLEQISFNVRDFGAAGDNVTDDTAAIAAAVTAAAAVVVPGKVGAEVFFPKGTYVATPSGSTPAVTPTSNYVTFRGAGIGNTEIRRNGNGVLLDLSGPSTDATGATHRKYCGVEGMTLNGNGQTGTVLRAYYADNHAFRRLLLTSSAGSLVDGVEFWDSRFDNCAFESSGGAADSITPMVWLRNSAVAGGFGFSSDNTNQIYFDKCRWEDFYNGALRIEQGTGSTDNPNGIYITNSKMETHNIRGGSHLYTDASCRAIWVDHLYAYVGEFFSGYSTAQNVISWAAQYSELANVFIANGATASINSGIDLYSGVGTSVLRNVVGVYTTAPTGAHVFFEASTGDFFFNNVYGTTGTQYAGTVPIRWEGQQPVKQIAAVPTDAGFSHTPLNGTLAFDTTAGRGNLYARLGGAWKSLVKTGTATLVAGTVTVSDTAVTANTRIFVTAQTTTGSGTQGFCRISAKTAGVSFVITSSSATDVSTVAYLMVEPA